MIDLDIFRKDGHLSDAALDALINEIPLDALYRLEISEHLSFCDLCLQRYTEALADVSLQTPEHSCREAIRAYIRARALRIFSSRYATATAAVALALTVLWGSKLPFFTSLPESLPPDTTVKTEETLPEHFDTALKSFSGNMRGLFEHIDTLRLSTERNLTP